MRKQRKILIHKSATHYTQNQQAIPYIEHLKVLQSFRRWIKWILSITKVHMKYDKTDYIKIHLIKHLNEYESRYKIRKKRQKWCESLYNLIFIYTFAYYPKMKLETCIVHFIPDFFRYKILDPNFYSKDYYISMIDNQINTYIKKIKTGNFNLTQLILLLKTLVEIDKIKFSYQNLIERLENFSNKKDKPFNVQEDGSVLEFGIKTLFSFDFLKFSNTTTKKCKINLEDQVFKLNIDSRLSISSISYEN
jgi:hypothetical protein